MSISNTFNIYTKTGSVRAHKLTEGTCVIHTMVADNSNHMHVPHDMRKDLCELSNMYGSVLIVSIDSASAVERRQRGESQIPRMASSANTVFAPLTEREAVEKLQYRPKANKAAALSA